MDQPGAMSSGPFAIAPAEEEQRVGRMAAWTKAFGKNDDLNPWSTERYVRSREHFPPLNVDFFLLTWDGRDQSLGSHFPPMTWSTGNRRYNVDAGDRVLLLRQTVQPTGFLAIGQMTGPAQEVPHLDPVRAEAGDTSLVAPIRWDFFEREPVLLREDVPAPIGAAVKWATPAGGIDLGAVGLFLDQEVRKARAKSREDERADEEIASDLTISSTEKEALRKARIGQGKFRANVITVEARGCRLTGVTDIRLLRAGHIKPWAVCTNAERLDGHNGLMFTPAADHLFDQGFISFTDDGDLIVATSYVDEADIRRLGLNLGANVGRFSRKQRYYLAYHRDNVFKGGGVIR